MITAVHLMVFDQNLRLQVMLNTISSYVGNVFVRGS